MRQSSLRFERMLRAAQEVITAPTSLSSVDVKVSFVDGVSLSDLGVREVEKETDEFS
jgi:hypothetical protein